jgi:signal transduction histidine kinase
VTACLDLKIKDYSIKPQAPMTSSLKGLLLLSCFTLIIPGFSQDDNKSIDWSFAHVPEIGVQKKIVSRGEKAYDFILEDMDDDGQVELGLVRTDPSHPFYIVVRELNSTTYTYPGTTAQVDTNGDAIFFPIKDNPQFRWSTYSYLNSTGMVTLYDHKLQPIDTIKVFDGKNRMDVNLQFAFKEILAGDLNHDGRTDALLRFNNGANPRPRSLMGFDLYNEQKLLQVDFAPLIYSTRIFDINDDGRNEILVGLGGAVSGSSSGLFHYDSSYVAVLDMAGRVLAKRGYGGTYTMLGCNAVDINNDMRTEIIVNYYCLVRDQKEISRLEILDGHTLKPLTAPLTNSNSVAFQYVEVTDADHDGVQDILVSSGDGALSLVHYDDNQQKLDVIKTAQCGGFALLLAVDDINQDGIDEWIFQARDLPFIFIVNNRLEPLAKIAVTTLRNKKLCLLPSTQLTHPFILLDGNEISELVISPDMIFPPPPFQFHMQGTTWRGSQFQIFTGVLAFLGLLGFTSVKIIHSFRHKDELSLSQSQRIGMAMIDKNGIVRYCNPVFLKIIDKKAADIHRKKLMAKMQDKWLAPLLTALETFIGRKEFFASHEISLGTAGRQRNISVEFIRSHQNGEQIKIILIDLCESTQTERVKIWAAMAQRVAHKTKTPLASVALAVQRLQKAYHKHAPEQVQNFDPLAKTAMTEIDRVRDNINNFMKFAKLDEPVFIVQDLNKSLQETLDEYRRRIPESIELDNSFDSSRMPVRLDIKQFREAVFNILDNAITAVKGDGIIRVNTCRESHPLNAFGGKDYAVMDISDSGTGIDENQLEKIFQPGHSTQKFGSGMGLVISKNIIETHGGEILLTSQSGVGTTVTICLPILQEGMSNE